MIENWREVLTKLVHIILALPHLRRIEESSDSRLLPHRTMALRQNHKLMSWYLIFLDRFPNDLLTHAIGVYVGRIPCVETFVIGGFEEG